MDENQPTKRQRGSEENPPIAPLLIAQQTRLTEEQRRLISLSRVQVKQLSREDKQKHSNALMANAVLKSAINEQLPDVIRNKQILEENEDRNRQEIERGRENERIRMEEVEAEKQRQRMIRRESERRLIIRNENRAENEKAINEIMAGSPEITREEAKNIINSRPTLKNTRQELQIALKELALVDIDPLCNPIDENNPACLELLNDRHQLNERIAILREQINAQNTHNINGRQQNNSALEMLNRYVLQDPTTLAELTYNYHGTDKCAAEFKDLCIHIQTWLRNEQYEDAIGQLNDCIEDRIRGHENWTRTHPGVVDPVGDNGHAYAIQTITELILSIEKLQEIIDNNRTRDPYHRVYIERRLINTIMIRYNPRFGLNTHGYYISFGNCMIFKGYVYHNTITYDRLTPYDTHNLVGGNYKKRKTLKRKTSNRKTLNRKTLKRKPSNRKPSNRKTSNRKTSNRKPLNRKTSTRKPLTVKR
jgi:hypothetical protein